MKIVFWLDNIRFSFWFLNRLILSTVWLKQMISWCVGSITVISIERSEIQVQILTYSIAFSFTQMPCEKAWIHSFYSQVNCKLALDGNQANRKKPVNFKLLRKAMANHSAIFSKNVWQFTDNKEEDSVESHDYLYS